MWTVCEWITDWLCSICCRGLVHCLLRVWWCNQQISTGAPWLTLPWLVAHCGRCCSVTTNSVTLTGGKSKQRNKLEDRSTSVTVASKSAVDLVMIVKCHWFSRTKYKWLSCTTGSLQLPFRTLYNRVRINLELMTQPTRLPATQTPVILRDPPNGVVNPC